MLLIGPGTVVTFGENNRIILPGLINAHMHFYSTFARSLAALSIEVFLR